MRKRNQANDTTHRGHSVKRRLMRGLIAKPSKTTPIENRNPVARFFHRSADKIEDFSLTRFVAALGIWLIIITLGTFWLDMIARNEERQARAEEREFRRLAQIATAWEVLLRPIGGDIGKGNALNTLIAGGQFVNNADFSCQAVGGFKDGVCVTPPQFNGLRFAEADFWATDPENVNDTGMNFGLVPYVGNVQFRGAAISDFRAEHLIINDDLADVDGSGWVVRLARAEGADLNLGDFICRDCAFYESELTWDIWRALPSAMLSNTTVYLPQDKREEIEAMFDAVFAERSGNPEEIERKYPPVISQSNMSFIAETHLDALVLFVWSDPIELYDQDTPEPPGYWPVRDTPTDDMIFWPAYEATSFCVNRADYDALKPVRDQQFEAAFKRAEESNANRRADSILPEIVIAPPTDEWSEGYTQVFSVPKRDELDDLYIAPTPEPYLCNLYMNDVEPLLRERLRAKVDRLVGR